MTTSTPAKHDEITFDSHGTTCAAWHWTGVGSALETEAGRAIADRRAMMYSTLQQRFVPGRPVQPPQQIPLPDIACLLFAESVTPSKDIPRSGMWSYVTGVTFLQQPTSNTALMNGGVPHADVETRYPGVAVASGCFIPPCPPPMPVLIDLKAIPEAPAGSDADRVGKGLAPRGGSGVPLPAPVSPEPTAAPGLRPPESASPAEEPSG